MNCIRDKQSCSFKSEIAKDLYPTIIGSVRGNEQRIVDNEKKREDTLKKKQMEAQRLAAILPSSQSTISGSTSSITTPVTRQSTRARAIETPSSLSFPIVEVPAPEAPGPIVRADLVAIEKVATRENNTRVELEMLRLFLITERTQERFRVEEHSRFVEERRSISLGLLDVLDDAIEARGGSRCNIRDSGEETSSEVSEEGDLESPPRTSLGESPQVLEDIEMTVSEAEIERQAGDGNVTEVEEGVGMGEQAREDEEEGNAEGE